MILKSAAELQAFAKRNPWLEGGALPPVITALRGRYVEVIGLSLNH